jgi:hypothetical protein
MSRPGEEPKRVSRRCGPELDEVANLVSLPQALVIVGGHPTTQGAGRLTMMSSATSQITASGPLQRRTVAEDEPAADCRVPAV